MADNVTTPTTGTGTATPVIATDDVSGVHYQRMKITDGTADSATHLKVVAEDSASADGDTGIIMMAKRSDTPGNSSGTDGDYEPLQMSNGAQWVAPLGFPKTIKVDVTRPADTTAYAVGDAISDSTSAPTSGGFTLSNAARKSGGSGIITDICVMTSADPATRLAGEIFVFDQSVTNINDNSAFAVSDSEIKNCVAVIPFALFDAGNNGMCHAQGLNILFTCSGSANLRFLLRTRNAYTPASGEVISVTFKILQID